MTLRDGMCWILSACRRIQAYCNTRPPVFQTKSDMCSSISRSSPRPPCCICRHPGSPRRTARHYASNPPCISGCLHPAVILLQKRGNRHRLGSLSLQETRHRRLHLELSAHPHPLPHPQSRQHILRLRNACPQVRPFRHAGILLRQKVLSRLCIWDCRPGPDDQSFFISNWLYDLSARL